MVKAHECPISKVREAKSTGGEGTIGNQVRLGDLLIRANLITEEMSEGTRVPARVWWTARRQPRCGRAISQKDLNAFVYKMPAGPPDIAIDRPRDIGLISLLMKLIYTERLETVRQFKNAIKFALSPGYRISAAGGGQQAAAQPGSGALRQPYRSWLCVH